MDAGFRSQIESVLHLVEGRRHAMGLEMTVDEDQQLVLFSGQHLARPLDLEQNQNVAACSSKVLGSGQAHSRLDRIRGMPHQML
jgi:hypothetical protein